MFLFESYHKKIIKIAVVRETVVSGNARIAAFERAES
jgi:hypothetical protein